MIRRRGGGSRAQQGVMMAMEATEVMEVMELMEGTREPRTFAGRIPPQCAKKRKHFELLQNMYEGVVKTETTNQNTCRTYWNYNTTSRSVRRDF